MVDHSTFHSIFYNSTFQPSVSDCIVPSSRERRVGLHSVQWNSRLCVFLYFLLYILCICVFWAYGGWEWGVFLYFLLYILCICVFWAYGGWGGRSETISRCATTQPVWSSGTDGSKDWKKETNNIEIFFFAQIWMKYFLWMQCSRSDIVLYHLAYIIRKDCSYQRW